MNTLIKRLVALLGIALMLLVTTDIANAAYVNRATKTVRGAITFTGNSLGLDSNGGAIGAGTNSPGTVGSIGAFTTTNTALQVANYPAGTTMNWTLNSANAELTLPPGSVVEYAELIWSGTYAYGGQDVRASLNNSISFQTPSGSYTIAPDPTTAQTLGVFTGTAPAVCTPAATLAGNFCRYVRSADVTGQVSIGKSGTYTVGGVPSTAGGDQNNNAAGWTLAVIYSNPSLPSRNMTLFVGAEAGGAAPTSVSGFCTNLSGPVQGRLLVSAIEGDAAISGDKMEFGPSPTQLTALSGPNNLMGNFFSGQINGDDGSLKTTGTFGTRNHGLSAGVTGSRQGYDITNIDVSGAMTNTQVSAFARGTTSGDQYTINALAIQIDVGAPVFPQAVKTANRTITHVGDTVTYTVLLDNIKGTANATNVVFYDTPPAGMSFVPGSVTINGIAQPSFNPITGFNVGTINAGGVSTVTFQVLVNTIPAAPDLAQFVNKARWTYDFISCANFPSESSFIDTNPNTINAIRIAPTKTVLPTGTVPVGQILNYTITVPNSGQAPTAGTTFADTIPAGTSYVLNSTKLNGVAVSDIAGAMPFIGGGLINSAGQSAGVIVPSASALIQFQVTVNNNPPSIITNTATIDADGAGIATPINVAAVNTPLTPPVANKSFAPSSISAGTTSLLTVTISNANAASLSFLALSDTLPAGLVIANPANVSTTCGSGTALATPGGITLGLSGGTIPPTGSCTVSASVLGSTAGDYINIIPVGGVSTANAGSNTAQATALLKVFQGPSISKSFSPAAIAPGGTAVLTITLINPTTTPLTSANVTDNLPSGLTIAATPNVVNNCGGTTSTTSTSLSLTNAGIPSANVCTVKVNVTAATVGNYDNTIPAGALLTSGGSNAAAASATITVVAPEISKGFLPPVVGVSATSVLTIAISNPSSVPITGANVTDNFPAGMTLVNNTSTNTCGGTLTNAAGGALTTNDTGVRLTGGSINPGGTCSITVNVRSTVVGNSVNTIPIGALTTAGFGSNTIAGVATLSVGQPSVSKAFGTIIAPVASAAAGSSVPMVIQLSNPNSTALTITSLIDTFPSGLTLASATINSNTCGSTVTDAAGAALATGSTSLKLAGGSIPSNSTCSVSVNVTATAGGNYTNTLPAGALKTPLGDNAFAASATIAILAQPTITKSFSPTTISAGGVSTLTITLFNSNAVTLSAASFTDTFPTTPGALTVANTAITNTCGGVVNNNINGTLSAGNVGIRLNGGNIPGNGSCAITIPVTASVLGNYTNSIAIAGLTTFNGGSSPLAANANLRVTVLPPIITKSFSSAQVGRNQATSVTLTISNPNVSGSLTGVTVIDPLPSLPAQMVIATTPNVTLSASCGGPATTAVAGSSSFSLSSATIAAGATCTATFNVQAPVAGTYNNVTNIITSTNGGNGNNGSASIRVLEAPAVSKNFLPSSVSLGGVSVLSVTISNPNPSDTLTGVAVNDAYISGLSNSSSPNPQVFCTAGSSATATGGTSGGNSVGLTGGNLAAGGFCRISVNVISGSVGSLTNTTGAVTSANAGSGNTANAVLLTGVDLSGFVYADTNTNSVKDSGEVGTALTLYAKLISGGVVQQVVLVNPATGNYSFSAVIAGTYTVIIDDNNNPADVTPTAPSGWAGTEAPTLSRTLNVAASFISNQNFGLSNARSVSGRVFKDNGISGGTANDGTLNGSELGLSNVIVRLTDCASTVLASSTTDGGGNFSMVIPNNVAVGTVVCLVETNLASYISTGAFLGSSSGSYNRSSDTLTFTVAAGVSITGIQFGDVPVNTLSTDGSQSSPAGSSVNYAHTFVAGSAGSVVFSTSAVANPALTGWNEVVYRDTDCSGTLDAGEPIISASLNVVAGDQICLVVKQFVPASAQAGASNIVTISAAFTYLNANPALSIAPLTRTDTTLVGAATGSGLSLIKVVDRANALPGSTLVYTITYTNNGSGPITNVVINDNTPAFTTFLSAACGANPPNIATCTLTSSPALGTTGPLVWTLTGPLLPSASSTVTFSVKVNP